MHNLWLYSSSHLSLRNSYVFSVMTKKGTCTHTVTFIAQIKTECWVVQSNDRFHKYSRCLCTFIKGRPTETFIDEIRLWVKTTDKVSAAQPFQTINTWNGNSGNCTCLLPVVSVYSARSMGPGDKPRPPLGLSQGYSGPKTSAHQDDKWP